MMDVTLTLILLCTTLSNLLVMALMLLRETTGLSETAGALAGERMDTSGFKDRALLSVELIQVLWMELLVLEDLAMMNSMCVDNVEFFLMSPILLELMSS